MKMLKPIVGFIVLLGLAACAAPPPPDLTPPPRAKADPKSNLESGRETR